jgi:dihydrofolate reductase
VNLFSRKLTVKKLKLQVQITVDGYITGVNGEMDWMEFNWDEKLVNYVKELTDSADSIVLGRKLAEGFIPHWYGVSNDATNSEVDAGKTFTELHKIVFSKTLDATHPQKENWINTVICKDDLVTAITTLKAQAGKDILVYGGGSFVSTLIENNLIDELHLFVNPAALGTGMKIFTQSTNLKLEEANSFSCGIVILKYSPIQ